MSVIEAFGQQLQASGLERIELEKNQARDHLLIATLSNCPPYLQLGNTMVRMIVNNMDELKDVAFEIFSETSKSKNGVLIPDRTVILPRLEEEYIFIGRDPELADRQLCLGDEKVSRRHAFVKPSADVGLIQDWDSTNGTVVYIDPRANYSDNPF